MLARAVVIAASLMCGGEAGGAPDGVACAIATILADMPGETAFGFASLDGGEANLLVGVRADERFAVGSTFKLYILGALIDEANAGRRRADDVMLLRADLQGPPASEMASWPINSPATLHTLALKMISISDNTATDHLHYLLGRQRIERQMVAMGHGKPEVNRPLLSTREMATLRDRARGLPGRKYATLDENGKREFLATLTRDQPDYEKLDFDTGAYDLAEWRASPMDMARAMAWIEQNTGPSRPAASLREILVVDSKLEHDKTTWPFVGFKGGSEDQLLAGNWLLKNKNGRWYSMHLYCNDPKAKVDQKKFIASLAKVFALVETTVR